MRAVGLILATAIAYFAGAKVGLNLAFVAEQVTVVWPPTGIALAALLLIGWKVWPGIALGAFLANATANEPLATAAGIAVGNTLEAVSGAWLLGWVGCRLELDRLRDVMAFIVVSVAASTPLSATIGVLSLCLGGVVPWTLYWSLWGVWWIGDMMGAIVVAPLFLAWAPALRGRVARRRAMESVAIAAATSLTVLLVFAGQPASWLRDYPLHYTVFPLVVIAALRLRQIGVTTVTCIASGIAIWSTAHGLGPFSMATTHESLIMVQLFMGVVAITGLLLSAAITERDAALVRQARDFASLEESEAWLRLALEAGRLGVWDWNIGTGAVRWTDNLEPMHGLPAGAFGGTLAAYQALVHPEDRARVDEAIRCAIEDSTGYDIEFRTLWPNGSVHWMAAKGTVITDTSGRPMRMLGTAMEVTDRRRLEEELRRHAQQLADADRRKDEFLAMLAHELRNPLAPLSTSLHLIASDAPDRARFLEMAERQVRHLVRLVDDLLDVSRISSGKVVLRTESVALSDVVARAVELSQHLVESRGHALTISLPPQPVRLQGDPIRLAQVIANLLSNAAKYTPPGGSIWLTAETVAAELTLRVRDTGIGIPPELLSTIFDLFVQGDASLDRARGGLGIGLTLVRGLVELHGGRVEAHSAGIGRGSEFIVRLPTLSEGIAPRQPPRIDPHEPVAPQPLRILIVEDHPDAGESLATILELWGHQVKVALDGFTALGTARSFEPDVVVSDLGLPGMDGYEVARRLRAEPAFGRVVLIALSGYGREEDKERSLHAGFDHHHVKPIDVTWLFSLLGQVATARAEARPRTLQ